jgi:hypothetical protein
MRRGGYLPVLTAGILSAPLALAIVVWRWARLDIGPQPDDWYAASVVIMRTFVVSFDFLVLALWLPCGIYFARLRSRLGDEMELGR